MEDAVKPVIVPPVKKTPLGLSGRPKSPIRAESPRRRKYSHSSESSSVSSSSESSESEEEQQPVEDKMAIDEAKKPYVVPALTNGILALKEQGCDASTAIDSKGFIKRTYLLGSQPNAILYAFSYFQPIGGARGLSYNIYNPDVHATHCSKSTQAFFVVPFNEINKCAVFFAQEVDLLGGIASIVNRLDQLSADNLLLPDGIRTIGLAFNFSTFSYTLNVTYQSIRSDELIKRTFTVSTGDLATVIEKFSPTDKRKRQW